MEISFWKKVSPFRKTNDECTRLCQKISSHDLNLRRLKNLHCLWIHQGNSPALKQCNEEWLVHISVEHKEPAIWAYSVERSFTTYHQKFRRSMQSYTLLFHCSLLYITYTWKCFSCLNVLHTEQRYICARQAEVHTFQQISRDLEQIWKLLTNNLSN